MGLLKKLFGSKVRLTRDVPNGNYRAVEINATSFVAGMRGQGKKCDIYILVPSFNEADYDDRSDNPVEAHYTDITHLGYLERRAIQKDALKRGCVTIRIDSHGFSVTEELADGIFATLAGASDDEGPEEE
jgi:hypothetical protein